MNKKIALFIPCYNEELRLKIHPIREFIDENKEIIDFIFIDDGSSDNTEEILNEYLVDNLNTFLIKLSENKGKGNALREGLLRNLLKPYEFYGFIDADFDIPFCQIKRLHKKLINSSFLIGLTTRDMKNNFSFHNPRSLASICMLYMANKLINLNPRINDTQCGCKLFHRDIAEICFKEEFISGWLFDIEIFLRLKKHLQDPRKAICEVPIKNVVSSAGSKFEFRRNIRIIKELYQIKNHYN